MSIAFNAVHEFLELNYDEDLRYTSLGTAKNLVDLLSKKLKLTDEEIATVFKIEEKQHVRN